MTSYFVKASHGITWPGSSSNLGSNQSGPCLPLQPPQPPPPSDPLPPEPNLSLEEEELLQYCLEFVRSRDWLVRKKLHPDACAARIYFLEEKNSRHNPIEFINFDHVFCHLCRLHIYNGSNEYDPLSYFVDHINTGSHRYGKKLNTHKKIIETYNNAYYCNVCNVQVERVFQAPSQQSFQEILVQHVGSALHQELVHVQKNNKKSVFASLALTPLFISDIKRGGICHICGYPVVEDPHSHALSVTHTTCFVYYLLNNYQFNYLGKNKEHLTKFFKQVLAKHPDKIQQWFQAMNISIYGMRRPQQQEGGGMDKRKAQRRKAPPVEVVEATDDWGTKYKKLETEYPDEEKRFKPGLAVKLSFVAPPSYEVIEALGNRSFPSLEVKNAVVRYCWELIINEDWKTRHEAPIQVMIRKPYNGPEYHSDLIDTLTPYHAYCKPCRFHFYAHQIHSEPYSRHVNHINTDKHLWCYDNWPGAFTGEPIIQASPYNNKIYCQPCHQKLKVEPQTKKKNLGALIEEHIETANHTHNVSLFRSTLKALLVGISESPLVFPLHIREENKVMFCSMCRGKSFSICYARTWHCKSKDHLKKVENFLKDDLGMELFTLQDNSYLRLCLEVLADKYEIKSNSS